MTCKLLSVLCCIKVTYIYSQTRCCIETVNDPFSCFLQNIVYQSTVPVRVLSFKVAKCPTPIVSRRWIWSINTQVPHVTMDPVMERNWEPFGLTRGAVHDSMFVLKEVSINNLQSSAAWKLYNCNRSFVKIS